MNETKTIIISIVIVFSLIFNVILYISAVNLQEKVEVLEQQRYEWCNSFNQVSNLLENIITEYVDESFVYEEYPNCELIKPRNINK